MPEFRRTAWSLLALAAIVPASRGDDPPAQQEPAPAGDASRVYGEWRIRVRPDQGPAYDRLIEQSGLPLFREAGGRMVGWWKTMIGDLYEQVTIWEYDDMAAFERAGQFLSKNAAFARFVAARDPLLAGEESRFLRLVTGAARPRLARAGPVRRSRDSSRAAGAPGGLPRVHDRRRASTCSRPTASGPSVPGSSTWADGPRSRISSGSRAWPSASGSSPASRPRPRRADLCRQGGRIRGRDHDPHPDAGAVCSGCARGRDGSEAERPPGRCRTASRSCRGSTQRASRTATIPPIAAGSQLGDETLLDRLAPRHSRA